MLHGCRQLVSWDVRLSPLTSATLIFSLLVFFEKQDFKETADDELEEGEDDVKSVWPLWAGLHSCYNGNDNKLQERKLELILKSYLSPDCRLQLAYMKMESLCNRVS